ncbi:SDR family NAD(P)-dependent oxidoreductase [Pseudonocardia sp. MH-G8]|uniref:SDR family NAD(P)-dependent oxidoreductase n=1 Tax=Pseudonocardia sp. MH-G8 TaxID=1854588 RepID=UPI000BA125BD|nr:SDR family NAD(P)-dependent oxidoreductase [Pseudonocardia sp. MH-G8]OZM78915.1 short-chain dehydrogenase [Pseudonocardia sp. MH-G8]
MNATDSTRTALVTGAGSGIGKAVARKLASIGSRLVLVDVDPRGLESTVEELAHTDVLPVSGDIAEEATMDEAVAAGAERFGQIDQYHLNAGIMGSFDPFPLLQVEDFDRVMSVNVRGTFLGLRAAFRQYARQDTAGSIVVTASIASLRGSADVIAYQTSKHAGLGLIRAAAMYGGPLGIRTNGVAPGLVPTELHTAAAQRAGGGGDIFERGRTVPMRRTGSASEVAEVVSFLLSDAASYVNGEVVSVDGGSATMSSVRPSGGAGRWDSAEVDMPARDASEQLRRR